MAKNYTKRNDGRYQKCVRIMGEDGIEKRKYVYAKSLTELERKVRKIEADNERGIYAFENVLLSEMSKKWLDAIEHRNAHQTLLTYKSYVRKIDNELGSLPIQKIRRSDVQQFINHHSDKPKTAEDLKITLHRILEMAIDDGIIYQNPCRNIVLPKYIRSEKRALTEIEKQAIEDAVLTEEERLYISLLYYTGMRRGEALALSRKDVDLKEGIITVNHSVTFINNKGVLKDPKTKTSKREIPIPDALYSRLTRSKGVMYYFTNNGDLYGQAAYKKFWDGIIMKLNAAAGFYPNGMPKIDGLTAHIFRHNYATMLHDNGVDMKTAQKLLGHSSINVTMDVYTHLDGIKDDTKEIINKCFKVS